MRMRQLMAGQSILFWPSNEADIRLRELSAQRKVESAHVMQFIENNTDSFKTNSMTHWAAGALNYTKKMSGHKVYEISLENGIEVALQGLYNSCVDDDVFELEELYSEKKEAALSEITWRKFDILAANYKGKKFGQTRGFILEMKDNVYEKLNDLAPTVQRFTNLDEEQEKELEQEVEEQAQIDRPKEAQPVKPHFDERLIRLINEGIGVTTTFNDMLNEKVFLSIVASLSNTQMSTFCENNEEAWARHFLVTKDFSMVVENQQQPCNDFLRPVFWIASIKTSSPARNALILLSSFECNKLIPAFRKSARAILYMYRPRLSNRHSNLIHDFGLQLSALPQINRIPIQDVIQIGVYSGLMYFANEEEQNAYCWFLGLIPGPWTRKQKEAFDDGNIEENGYVPLRKRKFIKEFEPRINECKFNENPIDFVIKLIKARHQVLPKDSHAASILNRGRKPFVRQEAMDTQ